MVFDKTELIVCNQYCFPIKMFKRVITLVARLSEGRKLDWVQIEAGLGTKLHLQPPISIVTKNHQQWIYLSAHTKNCISCWSYNYSPAKSVHSQLDVAFLYWNNLWRLLQSSGITIAIAVGMKRRRRKINLDLQMHLLTNLLFQW